MIDVFINKALQDAPAYEAWGGLVASEIMKGIILEHGEKEEFLRVPIKIRVKKESSIRGKIARYSGANFEDVVKDMVGVRFVVLLTSELELVQDAINSGQYWDAELVRHPDLQVDENPENFSYQSIHYLLTSKKDIDEGKVRIRAGLTCEVQIRTLLQHAYAELTHDNIYKPTQLVPSKAKRFVARSMALMETTDDLFCRTLEELRTTNLPRNELFRGLSRLFEVNGLWEEGNVNPPMNFEIIDACRSIISFSKTQVGIESLLKEKPYILEQIEESRHHLFLFAQPVVILLYYLVDLDDDALRGLWVFESLKEQLRLVYSNLGASLDDHL